MRDHELELIAALAEGRLEDESEARELLAASPEARAEFEAQMAALEALSTAHSTALTEAERATLRRGVWTELRVPAATARTSTPWYYRWVPAAAGLLVVVGLVAILNQGGDQATTVAADLAVDTTLAAAESAATMADSAGGDDAGATAPTTQAETDDAADGDTARTLSANSISFYRATAEDIRSGSDTGSLETFEEASAPASSEDCLREAGLDDYIVYGSYPAPTQTDDGEPEAPDEAIPFIAAIPADADLATATIAFVDPASCEVIHTDG